MSWRALLGMPGYGGLTAGAARGFFRASRDPARLVSEYTEGSLLAAGFNGLWCAALNRRRRGEPVDYFAMLHADVEPQDWWLDALVDELDRHALDVLSAVVPIKDPHGLTSTAVAHPSGDPWRVKCRLTMSEVHRLPGTFTSGDVGGPLLVNTGCWVARLGDWSTKVHFRVNDRIVFNAAHDRYEAQVEPEDWYFSRLCHELGLRIGATTKVMLAHAGSMRVRNTHAWGDWEYDRQYVAASTVPAAGADGFRFPADVAGWLSYDEGRALYALARGKRVLEVGSYCGRSTICLAQSAAAVVAVDPFDGRATPDSRDTFGEFAANLGRYGVADAVSWRVGTLAAVGEFDRPFDLVFVDGDHAYEAVAADAAAARAVLAPGGLIAFHDYRGGHEGVTRAVDELVAAGGELVQTTDTLAVVRPPARVLEEV